MPRTPKPVPDPSYGGVNGPRIVRPITLDHEHCVIATRAFGAGFAFWFDGSISPGLTDVRAGQLADDRSPLVLRYPDNWRRPTDADRKG